MKKMSRAPVVLNVYNMYWLNEYTSHVGLGVYHSGVEVYGKEYAYSGHPFDFTGIFEMDPKDEEELGEGFSFKETVAIGFTDFAERDISDMIEMLGKDYLGNSYHLLQKNCNHFTKDFAMLLCGKDIPSWVNRLASICHRIPVLAACIPKEWLTPEGARSDGNVDLTEWEQIEYPADAQQGSNRPLPRQTQDLLTEERNGHHFAHYFQRKNSSTRPRDATQNNASNFRTLNRENDQESADMNVSCSDKVQLALNDGDVDQNTTKTHSTESNTDEYSFDNFFENDFQTDPLIVTNTNLITTSSTETTSLLNSEISRGRTKRVDVNSSDNKL